MNSIKIERHFPESTIGIVSQGGQEMVPRKKGVTVRLHKWTNTKPPHLAEVFGPEEKDPQLYVAINLRWKGKELEEYSGIFELPSEVIEILEGKGYKIPEEFKT